MGKAESVLIGVCQLRVTDDKGENLRRAEELVGEAAGRGCRLVVLPEMFSCPYDMGCFARFAEVYPDGRSVRMLSECAGKWHITLVGGSIPERDGSRIYNSSFVFGPDGRLLARHRKIHLFDIDVPGKIRFAESEVFEAGTKPTVFETPDLTFGLAICYDLRFPELSRWMALAGAQVLIFPAAFNTTTGPAHWEVLLRARAIDNQVYVVASSPARNPDAGYQAYGHSMIVDPWGQILAEAGDWEDQVIVAPVEKSRVDEVRRQLPVLKGRKPHVYALDPERFS